MTKLGSRSLAGVVLAFSCSVLSYGQSASGTVRGKVLDQTGAAIVGGTVEIHNPVSHYDQSARSDTQGNVEFDNVPFNNYHVTANASGFQTIEQSVDVRSAVPIDLKFTLKVGAATTSVTVEAGAELVEADPTTHTDIDR